MFFLIEWTIHFQVSWIWCDNRPLPYTPSLGKNTVYSFKNNFFLDHTMVHSHLLLVLTHGSPSQWRLALPQSELNTPFLTLISPLLLYFLYFFLSGHQLMCSMFYLFTCIECCCILLRERNVHRSSLFTKIFFFVVPTMVLTSK